MTDEPKQRKRKVQPLYLMSRDHYEKEVACLVVNGTTTAEIVKMARHQDEPGKYIVLRKVAEIEVQKKETVTVKVT